VSAQQVLGPAQAFGLGKPRGSLVDLPEEPSEEGRSSAGRQFSRVVFRVDGVSADTRPEDSLLGRESHGFTTSHEPAGPETADISGSKAGGSPLLTTV
jgi:hypothetical protein